MVEAQEVVRPIPAPNHDPLHNINQSIVHYLSHMQLPSEVQFAFIPYAGVANLI